MRHSLLPIAERNALYREYRTRLFIVACFTASVAGLIGVAALFPAFLRSGVEEVTALNGLSSLSPQQNQDATVAATALAEAKTLGDALEANAGSARLSDLARAIASVHADSSITSITLTRTSATETSIVVEGISPTRDSLLLFKSRIEGAIPGAKVDIPVDQLTQDTDVKFSLTVTADLSQ